ncbi:MAG: hypothetical protein A2909_00795 [Candidatus Tagabacteria bacterium RIFCSPLOWO2_01_FULL_39_11]|uniref:dTDP-4-dehydrorhamnose reductase n=1 Tax=Candidatus Tagabacteria bacterium RIFCSPLOWO2_01_FULL_39_11 TaxID=1802295 RepID=A0A1G2LQC8_9BACT|nr:MAG: hypothetical protein A2909_00795 [Candidatus Tagabacteria bacterium RIFCSPLOWO2_01_FULL_39_11]
MKKEIVIFGNGWLGNKYKDYFGGKAEITSTDISDARAVEKILDSLNPQKVINAAGKTGRPNVDWCEDHKLETVNSNITGPLVLLKACLDRNIFLIHLSSGCLFNGKKRGGFTEEDSPKPPNFYARTKAAADNILKNFPVLILRLRMPIDNQPNPRNLITKLAKYPKIIDVENSVTIVKDLIWATDQLIKKRKTGIYNVTNPGPVKHRDILKWYKKLVDPHHQYQMIPLKDLTKLGLAKTGRSNCILNTKKLERAGIKMTPAKTAIIKAFKIYKANL